VLCGVSRSSEMSLCMLFRAFLPVALLFIYLSACLLPTCTPVILACFLSPPLACPLSMVCYLPPLGAAMYSQALPASLLPSCPLALLPTCPLAHLPTCPLAHLHICSIAHLPRMSDADRKAIQKKHKSIIDRY
jgi:hypothetical protein